MVLGGVGGPIDTGLMLKIRALHLSYQCLMLYSFQALPFYLKLGFEEVGRYKNFPVDGVDKIFLQKMLNKSG